jgi:hypothetical protein
VGLPAPHVGRVQQAHRLGLSSSRQRVLLPILARVPGALILDRIGKGSCETHGERSRI